VADSIRLVRRLAPDYELRTTVVPGLVGADEVRAIAREIAGAKRYVLQQFVPRSRLLDPRWAAVSPYPRAWLEALAEEISPHFPEPVRVRGAT
jgi:pyruvate formate lyase activating enzyme